ncbi:MAG TPA: hypothetical protein PKA41_03160 [Verrucomicrobiota bacterium]|nr:hypothetical protein [Verrucomicrobiota bacterium]
MKKKSKSSITDVIGQIPYRLALAGGWIDQPFVSQINPTPPGSMVVVCIEPQFRFMDRSGICGSTREVALQIWKKKLPKRDPARLMRELYQAENRLKANPSGSQDMAGLVYPGISRLDYDFNIHGGVFPAHVESLNDARTACWLENAIHILPVASRPEGYSPITEKNLAPKWISKLGQTGKDCFDAIRCHDMKALGKSFNECMICWETILPLTVRHPLVTADLVGLMRHYQQNYYGAMYSGCGGGYLFVVSDEPVPGAFQAKVRTAKA